MYELRRILVPLDGSLESEQALPIATALAKQFDSEVLLLRVLDTPMPSLLESKAEALWIREAVQHRQRELELYLEAHQAALAQDGVQARHVVHDNSPAEDILWVAASEPIDLIVMTSHGEGGSTRWSSGSVADKVLQHSPCPVLLVRVATEGTISNTAKRFGRLAA
jgi:nucleotide-binding universal stress UspA family protein